MDMLQWFGVVLVVFGIFLYLVDIDIDLDVPGIAGFDAVGLVLKVFKVTDL